MASFTYEYPRPSVTVDVAAFVDDGGTVKLLLIRRRDDPFAGRLALPGGFVDIDEPFEDAARRELKEETGLVIAGPLGFVGVFGELGRDPRGRTVTLAHGAILSPPLPAVVGGDDASEALWVPFDEATGLAFDHDLVVAAAVRWLRSGGAGTSPTAYAFPFEAIKA